MSSTSIPSRCQAITAKNVRCSRKTQNNSTHCSQHLNLLTKDPLPLPLPKNLFWIILSYTNHSTYDNLTTLYPSLSKDATRFDLEFKSNMLQEYKAKSNKLWTLATNLLGNQILLDKLRKLENLYLRYKCNREMIQLQISTKELNFDDEDEEHYDNIVSFLNDHTDTSRTCKCCEHLHQKVYTDEDLDNDLKELEEKNEKDSKVVDPIFLEKGAIYKEEQVMEEKFVRGLIFYQHIRNLCMSLSFYLRLAKFIDIRTCHVGYSNKESFMCITLEGQLLSKGFGFSTSAHVMFFYDRNNKSISIKNIHSKNKLPIFYVGLLDPKLKINMDSYPDEASVVQMKEFTDSDRIMIKYLDVLLVRAGEEFNKIKGKYNLKNKEYSHTISLERK